MSLYHDYLRKKAAGDAMSEAELQGIALHIADLDEADYSQESFRQAFGQTALDLAGVDWAGRFGPIMRGTGYEILLKMLPGGAPGCEVRQYHP